MTASSKPPTRPFACTISRCATRCRTRTCSRNTRSEEHTSELQSQSNLVCRLLLEKKKKIMCSDSNALSFASFTSIPPAGTLSCLSVDPIPHLAQFSTYTRLFCTETTFDILRDEVI